ncbi:MAG: carbonate dehydratase [Bacteroidetes bacterium]|nr:MAG: carbonate dehydratase [Bacteroidota bacterium]
MRPYEQLLQNNRIWSAEKMAQDPHYFDELAKEQTPEFLWIGCSDSRVPANEVTQTEPGEIFVHRNIANMVVHTDVNMLSVLQYAVQVLKVPHVIVCGHYGCGGVKAALTRKHIGIVNKWLRNIKDIYRLHETELEAIEDENMKVDRLTELNVQEQIMNLAKTSIIQESWHKHQRPTLHGWIYDLHTGLIKEIINMDYTTKLDDIYMIDFD